MMFFTSTAAVNDAPETELLLVLDKPALLAPEIRFVLSPSLSGASEGFCTTFSLPNVVAFVQSMLQPLVRCLSLSRGLLFLEP